MIGKGYHMCRLRIGTLEIILLCSTILSFSFIPAQVLTLEKYMITAYFLIKYIKQINNNKIVFSLLFMYSIVLTFSTAINIGNFRWSLSALMHGVQLMTFFIILPLLCYREGTEEVIRVFFYYFLIMLLINDISMLIVPYDFSYSGEVYLVGDKFSVSYAHCLLSSLYYMLYQNNKKKWLSLIFIGYSCMVTAIIHCTTGLLMSIAMAMFIFIPGWIRRVLENPLVLLGFLAIENILIWSSVKIFSNPVINTIIVNLFHKSSTLTGRFKLYSAVLPLVSQKPLFGYGHKTNIFRDMFGYGNAQNGLFDIIIQAGILGAILYFSCVLFALRKRMESCYGMYIFAYAMILGSAVEINLEITFMLGISMIYASSYANKRIEPKANVKIGKR